MSNKLARKLSQLDWTAYQQNVLDAVSTAVKNYTGIYASIPSEAVYQVGIWTDPQALFTAINFETKHHAEQQREQQIGFFVTRGLTESADMFKSVPYNVSPADFKYSEFYTTTHDELSYLCEVDYVAKDNAELIGIQFEQALLVVKDKVVSLGMLDALPREEHVWVGVNSPRDWYDHVILI